MEKTFRARMTPPGVVSKEETPIIVHLNEKEKEVLNALAEKQELSQERVMRMALSLYQLHVAGHLIFVRDPLSDAPE